MSRPTAVILGGGVTGLSTAYHLARNGYGRIILLDKGPIGDGSSSRAAAIITGLLWSETGVLARKVSLRLFRELSEELPGYTFQATGCLNLFDAASWPERAALLPLYERCGAPFELLDAAAMRTRWPALHPPDDAIGLYDPLGGYSEPDEYIPALAQRCRDLGVEIREYVQVEALVLSNGRVVGVRTATETIAADAVVSTLYAWTNLVLQSVDLRLPLKAFVHQRYVTTPLSAPLDIPAVNANPLGGYVRSAAGGRLLFGIETADRSEHRITAPDFRLPALSAPAELPERIRTTFTPYVPALGTAAWEQASVGLITFAMDGEPVLGPVARLPGLFVGVAFHSGGFAYNPVAGMLLAEFVAAGRTGLDVRAFAPDRFDPVETAAYLAETLAQKDVVRRRH
jgi:4-methylaminobutanoate oxidase (formaldehyde-forming)